MAATKSRVVSPVRTFDQNGREKLPHRVVRDLIEMKNPDKYKANLSALGLSQDKPLYWEDVKRLLALRLFLADNNGGNSIAMFVYLERQKLIKQYFQERDIDLQTKFGRLQDKYLTQVNGVKVSRYTGGLGKVPKPQTPEPARV